MRRGGYPQPHFVGHVTRHRRARFCQGFLCTRARRTLARHSAICSLFQRRELVRSLLALPLVIASHIFYGLGFWRGLFTALKPAGQKPAFEVQLETLAP